MALLPRRTPLASSALAAVALIALTCGLAATMLINSAKSQAQTTLPANAIVTETQTAIFAGGCFWCVEKDFDHVAGVLSTTSGYIGGRHDNPTYESHTASGDWEAVQITYDPSVVSYEQLTYTFFRTVDPLDGGGQFCDRGHSYTTAVFTLDDVQRTIAQAAAQEASQALDRDVRTRIIDAPTFWPAEDYHQDYYMKNPLRYNFYRTSCGRNRTVESRWGDAAYAGVDQ